MTTGGGDLVCAEPARRQELRKQKRLVGLDFVEVSGAREISLHFIGPAPEGLATSNIWIEGGVRVRDLRALELDLVSEHHGDGVVRVRLDRNGDRSPYRLHLVRDRTDDRQLLDGVDPRYGEAELSFDLECARDIDCAPVPCPPEARVEPDISYLAKDYSSFRQLIFDRLSLLVPDWQERHAADMMVALVELLAYVGDQLSYHQDAVATEAYLATARQRISVRRHAKLVDYALNEGCNARTWVFIWTSDDLVLRPRSVSFTTALPPGEAGPVLRPTEKSPEPLEEIEARYEVFEPYDFDRPIQLYRHHNLIRLYTWGDTECCLERGATRATLVDCWADAPIEKKDQKGQYQVEQAAVQQVAQHRSHAGHRHGPDEECDEEEQPPPRERCLHLAAGDLLLFQETRGPRTGVLADADPTHRQVVRLTRVTPTVDPLFDIPVLEIEWAPEDALGFTLCISTIGPAPACRPLRWVSVARGNIVLVDHGRRIRDEDLGCVPVESSTVVCCGPRHAGEVEHRAGRFRPRLDFRPLTHRAPLPEPSPCDDHETPSVGIPASVMLEQDPALALPQIVCTSIQHPIAWDAAGACAEICQDDWLCEGCGAQQKRREEPACTDCGREAAPLAWWPRADLFESSGRDRHFVVETDNRGFAWLRFGDGTLGRRPPPGATFTAEYRVGNGTAGNVGAGAIRHLVLSYGLDGVDLGVRNPFAAEGGREPEPLEEARLLAPSRFRTILERAIIPDDYARIAERPARPGDARRPRVQRASAALRWTGSWYEMLVAVDPLGKTEPDPVLLCDVEHLLARYRRIGHDLRVAPARLVPLEIELCVLVKAGYIREHVLAAVRDVLSNRVLPGGRRGFFHPDELTFGTDICLTALAAVVQAVDGVEGIFVPRFERLFEGPADELDRMSLELGPFEIARLDNDPLHPENGLLILRAGGGR